MQININYHNCLTKSGVESNIMETLSKKELAQIAGGSLEDWCASIEAIISNEENLENLPDDGTMHEVYELYNEKCR